MKEVWLISIHLPALFVTQVYLIFGQNTILNGVITLDYKQKPAEAMLYADSMLNILKDNEQEYSIEYMRTLMIKGDILMAENRYDEAFQSFYDGRSFAEHYLDVCRFYELNSRLGLTRYRQGNYLQAVSYIKKTWEETGNCTGPISDVRQWCLNTIGLCFEKAGMPDSAVYYYKQTLAYIDHNVKLFSTKDLYAEQARGIVYGNLGGTYMTLKSYGLAENYLKASIKINDRPGYYQDDAKTAQIKLAHLYINLSRFAEADDLLKQVEDYIDAGRRKGSIDNDLLLKWRKLSSEYFDGIKDTKKAYSSAESYYSLRDSLNKAQKGLERVNLDEGLRETGGRYRLELLSKSNQLKTTYLSAIIVFSILILIILGMAWYNLKRSRRNVGKLTDLNQIINNYNAQLQSALTALEESYQENNNLMQVVAHDLRAPIGGIAVIAAKMLKQDTLPSGGRATLELIAASAKDSLSLVSDLLKNYTSIKKFKTDPVDMYTLLEHCVAIMRLKAEEKDQQIELDAGRFKVYVNREKMSRVIINLIANAVKFSPLGAVIRVTMLKKEDKVLITIDDNGIGIPVEIKDKVFDMFTEAKRPGTTGEQPFGIGLAISKQIVEMHGGEIWFENKQANGTLFYIELPYRTAV